LDAFYDALFEPLGADADEVSRPMQPECSECLQPPRPRCSQVRALLLDKQRAFGRRLMPWLLVEVVAAAAVVVVVVGRIGQLRSGQVK